MTGLPQERSGLQIRPIWGCFLLVNSTSIGFSLAQTRERKPLNWERRAGGVKTTYFRGACYYRVDSGETTVASMSSPKTPPCQKTATSAFNIFRGFSRKQKKVVNVSVIGGEGVGKSGWVLINPHLNLPQPNLFAAFVVRFLTRRFIGDYSSSLSCAYPHTLSLDNAPVSVISLIPLWCLTSVSRWWSGTAPPSPQPQCTPCVSSWTRWERSW